jgi:DNA-binding NarL/FixJ family response regulator
LLFISATTVKTHIQNILQKLDVSDRTQAAVHAVREGLI